MSRGPILPKRVSRNAGDEPSASEGRIARTVSRRADIAATALLPRITRRSFAPLPFTISPPRLKSTSPQSTEHASLIRHPVE